LHGLKTPLFKLSSRNRKGVFLGCLLIIFQRLYKAGTEHNILSEFEKNPWCVESLESWFSHQRIWDIGNGRE